MILEPFKIVFQVYMHQKDEDGNVVDEVIVTNNGDPFNLYSHQFGEFAERIEAIAAHVRAQSDSANVGTEPQLVFPENGNGN